MQCPYCWAEAELPLDPDDEGELVVDCEVCCQPWAVFVWHDERGEPHATVERAQ